MGRELAIFDLDGTITRGDTLASFCSYSCGRLKWMMALTRVLPALLLAKLKGESTGPIKERLFGILFKGRKEAEVQASAKAWASLKGLEMVRPEAIEEIERLKKRKVRVIIVTASLETWVLPLASLLDVEVIATRAEAVDGILTGRFATPNCKGEEKLRRIRSYLDLADYDHISAYGDSRADLPMLSIAHEAHYRPWC